MKRKRKSKDEMTYEELRRADEREEFIIWKIIIPSVTSIVTTILMDIFVWPEILPFYLRLLKI